MTHTETATATRVQIGNGDKVHYGTTEGMTLCSAGRRNGRRSGTRVLPAATPVTCTKCDPNAAQAPAAPAAPVASGFCACGARLMRSGECAYCAA